MKVRLLKVKKPFASVSNKAGHTMARTPLRDLAPRKLEHFPRTLKQHYELSDLDLQGGDHIKTWKTSFIPSLLAWAGACDDPFKVSSELFTAVGQIWERTFPAIALLDDKLLALVKVVSRMD